MSNIFECKEDGVIPPEFVEAGNNGTLVVVTCGLNILLAEDEFDGGRNGVTYKIISDE